MNSWFLSLDPVVSLAEVHKRWKYEPDKPNYTPRISGCMGINTAVLGIIKKDVDSDKSIREYFEIPLLNSKGRLISTYAGKNIDPLPSFNCSPMRVEISATNPKEIARGVYDSLYKNGDDYRVSVVAGVLRNDEWEFDVINRNSS